MFFFWVCKVTVYFVFCFYNIFNIFDFHFVIFKPFFYSRKVSVEVNAVGWLNDFCSINKLYFFFTTQTTKTTVKCTSKRGL